MEPPLSPLDFGEVVSSFQRALKLMQDDRMSEQDTLEFIDELLPNQIKGLQNLLCCRGFGVAERSKIQNTIGLLFSIHNRMKCCVKSGAGVQEQQPTVVWNDIQSAFDRRIRTGAISNVKHTDPKLFLEESEAEFIRQINVSLKEHNSVKVYGVLAAEFEKYNPDNDEIKEIKYFNTEAKEIYLTTPLSDWYKEHIQQPVLRDLEEFQERDSGWSLHSIMNLTLNINKLNPLRGSSYIPLPAGLKSKQSCVNVQNKTDNECFKWAILSALYPVKRNGQRVIKYENYKDVLKFGNIQFPVKPTDISKFEKLNPWLSVNLFMLEKKDGKFKVFPCYLTSEKKEKHVNLLFVEERYYEEDEFVPERPSNFHYVWIKNLSGLVGAQCSKKEHKKHFCDRCFHFFGTENKLLDHTVNCIKMNKCKVNLPNKYTNTLEFKHYKYHERAPFVIYADIECLLKAVQDENDRVQQEHEPFSIAYYLKSSFDDSLSKFEIYRRKSEADEKPATWFVNKLLEHAKKLEKFYENPQKMKPLTREQIIEYNSAKECHICRRPFTENDKKVRDHCHFTGEYRGPGNNGCNINYQDSFEGSVTLLPLTKEKYISFTKKIAGSKISFRFIDSYRFMASSLEKLANYLNKHKVTDRILGNEYTPDKIELLKKKGVFPYEHVTSLESLEEPQLPPKEAFNSTLNNSEISEEDYERATNVWETFGIKTLGDYSDLYLQTDVLLLADVFENFRDSCISEDAYGLDPAHYYTTPGFTWDAMLKKTQVKLELLTDPDMLLFVEKGIRGGVSQCSNRYAKANNPYMQEFNPDEETKYLMYYDVNNLYGWAMTQALPVDSFQWVDSYKCEITKNFFDVPDDNEYGYILEVDLDYPEEYHEEHKDLPFCPEHRAAPDTKDKKLMTTLHPKENYVIHYRALKQALDHGMVLKKIHKAISFRQTPWLKSYIDFNSEKRKNAKNEFEKHLFKLFNNAVYGKTMENERKRVKVKLVTHWDGVHGAEALIARPNFKSQSIFKSNLVAIELALIEVTMMKPIYVGLSVLDLSKTVVYRFHYDYIKNRLGDKSKLLYTDTDSLIYEIKDADIYKMMEDDWHEFDTSDYPADNKFGVTPNLENKKKVGVMKDECNGNLMTEFVGLRSKMYSVRVEGQEEIKKSKGVKSNVIKTTITFDDYLRCLMDGEKEKREQLNIRSRLHVVFTEKMKKVALSPFDTKRFLIPGSTDTLPWGHRKIEEIKGSTLPTADKVEVKESALPADDEVQVVGEVEGRSLHKAASRPARFSSACDQPPTKRSKQQ